MNKIDNSIQGDHFPGLIDKSKLLGSSEGVSILSFLLNIRSILLE